MRKPLINIQPTAVSESLQQGKPSGSFMTKYLVIHCQKIADLERDLDRLPEKEEFFFLQSDNSFNAFTFIPWIVQRTPIRHLHICTYSINQRVINSLIELHADGYIAKITILLSDTIIKRNPNTVDILSATNKAYPNIEIIFAWVHAKIALARTDTAYFTIEGSGNFSENAYYEQYVVANSAQLYDFRMKLFEEVQVRHKILDGQINL